MSETAQPREEPFGDGPQPVAAETARPESAPHGADSKSRTADPADSAAAPKDNRPPPYKQPRVLVIAGIVLLVLVLGGILYWRHARQFVSTDDAYIEGHVTEMRPQVSGRIAVLHVTDNQLVQPGEVLLEIDPTDYQVAVEQAQAQVQNAAGRYAQAEAQIPVAQAAVTEAAAEVDAAQVALDNATQDLQRYQAVDARARSQQQLDKAVAAQKNAQAQLARAQARKTSATADVAAAQAAVKAAAGEQAVAAADLKRAQVTLSYCTVRAPSAGWVTDRSIEAGAYVVAGQTLFSLVRPDVWVTANFKETQLQHLQPGQPVTIKVDAFPDVEYHGHMDSVQAGTGARFSLLRPENATGNFVKVVQRVPVKIRFDADPPPTGRRLLAPGMSVEPTVTIR